eukprot:TRINITY_DN60354_c0_g1_i1.p1 TRINITY_DN60354_c0_g1~~TRINITY_DN60354_c0_g1_i1.p1  ORF type:complete len:1061 (+),score=225.19 TRINITY_DN60354_c0_g1_i1:83-3265(+)
MPSHPPPPPPGERPPPAPPPQLPPVALGPRSAEFEFFIVGDDVKVPRIKVQCPLPYRLEGLLRAIEERVGLADGSVAEVKAFDPESQQWFWPSQDVPPPAKTKLWLRCAGSGDGADRKPGGTSIAVSKEPVASTSREFRASRQLLDAYLRPLGRELVEQSGAQVLMRTTLVKVEALSHPELEYLYEQRRRSLHDPEHRVLQIMGGPRAALKRIAACGFELPATAHPFGRGALVFGSDARSLGERAKPDPTLTNKLLACEVALGVPKVVGGPVPTATLEELTAQGCDSVVVTAADDDPDQLEHAVVYHPHQAIPRHMLTYTVEFVDSETLCPQTGEELDMVCKQDGRLVSVRTALDEASRLGVEFEPLHAAAERERRLFAAKRDDVTTALDAVRAAYGELEALHKEAQLSIEAAADRVRFAVEEICSRAHAAGERLICQMRERQADITRKVDEQLLSYQMSEHRAREMHAQLEAALHDDSDAHFYRDLDFTRRHLARMQEEASAVGPLTPELRAAIEDAGRVTIDVGPVLQAIDAVEWHEVAAGLLPAAADVPQTATPQTAKPLQPPPADPRPRQRSELMSLHPASHTDSRPATAVPTPAPDPLSPQWDSTAPPPAAAPPAPQPPPEVAAPPVPPEAEPCTWTPPIIDVDPATVLPWEEVQSSGVRQVALACGRNDCGQLGLGAANAHGRGDAVAEVMMPPGVGVIAVAAGYCHTLFLGDDGWVYAAGSNERGQLGQGHRAPLGTPSPVLQGPPRSATFRTIASGDDHSLAVTDAGRIYSWGRNDSGQLGLGHLSDVDAPWAVIGPLESVTVAAVSAGAYHSAALSASGDVWTWGSNEHRQLGHAGAAPHVAVPQVVRLPLPDGVSVSVLECGGFHCLALCGSTGRVYAWGRNNDGRLGLGHGAAVSTPQLCPVLSDPADPVLFVAAGRHSSVAHLQSGRILAWGGAPSPAGNTPRAVSFLAAISLLQVAAGGYHSVALSVDNALFAWGQNNYGQLGVPDQRSIEPRGDIGPALVQMPPAPRRQRRRVVSVVCGCQTTFVILAVAHGHDRGSPAPAPVLAA